MPPATPPAIAPTLGLLFSPVRTGAKEEVGLADGVMMIVLMMVEPPSVRICSDVCGSGTLLDGSGVGAGVLLFCYLMSA